MRGTTFRSFSYFLFALALVCCGAAGFLVWNFSGSLAARQQLDASATSASQQEENAVRAHALAQTTASERAALQLLVQTDLISIAGRIKSAGQSAGTQTTIGSVSSGPLAAQAPAGLNTVEFLVQSQGSFSQVMQAARLFETLPVPSVVEQFDFERVPSDVGSAHTSWQLTARIRVLTDASISS